MTTAVDFNNERPDRHCKLDAALAIKVAEGAFCSISGAWRGHYTYLGGTGLTSPFVAKMTDDSGRLGGEMIEADRRGGLGLRQASIAGQRQGTSVKFTAFGTPRSIAFNSIDYVGRLSDDGNTISGTWTFQIFDGLLEMHREVVDPQGAEEQKGAKPR